MREHFRVNWWKYLLVIILPVVLWCTVFSERAKPNADERLRVLYAGEGLDVSALQADLAAALPSLTGQKLREVTVTQETPGDINFGEWLIARQFSYDVMILQDSFCPENIGQNYFKRMKDTLVSRFPSAEKYTETVEGHELTYALVVCGGNGYTRFSAYCSTQESCRLFFSPESVNLGAENGKGKEKNNAAIAAAQYLSEVIR